MFFQSTVVYDGPILPLRNVPSRNFSYKGSTGLSFRIGARKVLFARGFSSFCSGACVCVYFKKACFLLPRITPCGCRWRSVQWWATVAYCSTANAEKTSTRQTLSWGEKPGILWAYGCKCEHACHILIATPIVSQTMLKRAISHKWKWKLVLKVKKERKTKKWATQRGERKEVRHE